MQVRPALFLNAAMGKTLYFVPRRTRRQRGAASRGRANFQTGNRLPQPKPPPSPSPSPPPSRRHHYPLMHADVLCVFWGLLSPSPCLPRQLATCAAHRAYKKARAKGRAGHTTRVAWGPKVAVRGSGGRTHRGGRTDERKGKIWDKARGRTPRTGYW